jgi:hypothetical protein
MAIVRAAASKIGPWSLINSDNPPGSHSSMLLPVMCHPGEDHHALQAGGFQVRRGQGQAGVCLADCQYSPAYHEAVRWKFSFSPSITSRRGVQVPGTPALRSTTCRALGALTCELAPLIDLLNLSGNGTSNYEFMGQPARSNSKKVRVLWGGRALAQSSPLSGRFATWREVLR